MKLNKDFILHKTNDESILVPTGNAEFSGVVRGNKTFGSILELLKDDTTEEQIVASLTSRYEAPDGAVAADVKKALAELRKIGALDE